MNSIKKLSEMGIAPIKCENKIGNDKLKELHYKVNQTIFFYSKKFINKAIKAKLMDIWSTVGLEIKNLDVPQSAKAKKEEILQKLRERFTLLLQYKTDLIEEKLNYGAMQTMKYQVSTYLYKKDHNTLQTPEQIIELLNEFKTVASDWKEINKSKWPQSFIKAKDELLQRLSEIYDF
jgi:hypothetical protein